MKRKWLAIILIGVMVLSMLNGCSKDKESESGSSDSNTIYGEVSAVGDDSITIKVGIMKQMGRQGDENVSEGEKPSEPETNNENADAESNADTGDNQMKQKGSMLDLTGEEKEIKVTADTVIKEMSGGFGHGNMGNPGAKPNGSDEQGSMPEMPSGGEQGTMSEMPSDADGQGTPPEIPSGADNQGAAPEMPSGAEQGSMPEMPSGENGKGGFEQEAEEIELDDIVEGDIVSITLDDDGNAKEITVMSFGGNMGQPGNEQNSTGAQVSGVDSYDAVKEYSSDAIVDGETFKSTGKDENAIHILSGSSAIFSDITVTRRSSNSSGGDNSSFYGVGAALLTSSGTAYIKSSKITTDAAGGAGIFAYDKGTVYAADTKIKTTKDTSGGIHVAGGGNSVCMGYENRDCRRVFSSHKK